MEIKPYCCNFKPSALASWICGWWNWEYVGVDKIEWFCSRPAWEERACETRGLRLMPRADQEDDGWQDAMDLGETR